MDDLARFSNKAPVRPVAMPEPKPKTEEERLEEIKEQQWQELNEKHPHWKETLIGAGLVLLLGLGGLGSCVHRITNPPKMTPAEKQAAMALTVRYLTEETDQAIMNGADPTYARQRAIAKAANYALYLESK